MNPLTLFAAFAAVLFAALALFEKNRPRQIPVRVRRGR